MAFKSLSSSSFTPERRERNRSVWNRAERPVVGKAVQGWLVGEVSVWGFVCVCETLGLEVTAG